MFNEACKTDGNFSYFAATVISLYACFAFKAQWVRIAVKGIMKMRVDQ